MNEIMCISRNCYLVITTVSVVAKNLSFTMDKDFDPSYNNSNSTVYKDANNAVSFDLLME